MNQTPAEFITYFRVVILDGHWISNTNFENQIIGLSWEQAITKVGSLNAIVRLVNTDFKNAI